MRTRLTFAVAIAIAASTYARSASNPDAIPIPRPNPFRTAAPALNPSNTAAPAPNPSKAATPAPNPSNTAPTPSPSKAGAPAPNPSKSEAPAAYDHNTAAGFWQETDDQGHAGGGHDGVQQCRDEKKSPRQPVAALGSRRDRCENQRLCQHSWREEGLEVVEELSGTVVPGKGREQGDAQQGIDGGRDEPRDLPRSREQCQLTQKCQQRRGRLEA